MVIINRFKKLMLQLCYIKTTTIDTNYACDILTAMVYFYQKIKNYRGGFDEIYEENSRWSFSIFNVSI